MTVFVFMRLSYNYESNRGLGLLIILRFKRFRFSLLVERRYRGRRVSAFSRGVVIS